MYRPPQMYVTTDAVTVRWSPQEGLCVLLIRRANPPYEGYWALPGGFVEEDEDLADACARELEEETGVRPELTVQMGAWGKPGRDPRGRNVSVAYLAVARPDVGRARAGSDAANAEWHPAAALPLLAFDHADMVGAGLDRLRALAGETHLVFALLPERFGLDELRNVLAQVGSNEDAAALIGRADVEEGPSAGAGQASHYGCTAGEFLAPLRRV